MCLIKFKYMQILDKKESFLSIFLFILSKKTQTLISKIKILTKLLIIFYFLCKLIKYYYKVIKYLYSYEKVFLFLLKYKKPPNN